MPAFRVDSAIGKTATAPRLTNNATITPSIAPVGFEESKHQEARKGALNPLNRQWLATDSLCYIHEKAWFHLSSSFPSHAILAQ
ncbi:unnamed protein product [Dovyalis caffra]|uniref:Uncharacterized protein n=1 Tax=Dovyalis caffra TaxID=77055 RepID=A0AAV1S576_9ROSI|nr:unnamed protein product [Dovyalis caffra]